MLAVERRKLILGKVHAEKKVIVSELSKEFEVSEETIRRDLDKLADEGGLDACLSSALLTERHCSTRSPVLSLFRVPSGHPPSESQWCF